MNRDRIERQLKLAEANLASHEKTLNDQQVEVKQRRKNPQWRSLQADVRSLKRRLQAVGAIEEREAAAIARKSGESAAESAE